MITRKSTFFLGIFIFLIPFLGVPTSWKTLFVVVSGLVLILLSIKTSLPSLPKKTALKPRVKKEKSPPIVQSNIPKDMTENQNMKVKSMNDIQVKSDDKFLQ